MSNIPTVNYRETYFPKPDLTQILGKPDFESLYQLITDLRANAISVHSNLGGGNHGHLGLIMTPQQYAIESQTPFERPDHPGTLHIPQGTVRNVAEHVERTFKENLRVFHEVRGVEKALTQQLVSAIEDKYLLAFKNRTTGQFNGNLLDIIQYLQATYGQISPAQLSVFEKETVEMTYDPIEPIDIVFDKIEDLLMYGDFAQCPYTAEQAIQKAYNIINATGVYKEYIKLWRRREPLTKTWTNFKTEFRQAQHELQETGELTLAETDYGTANMVQDIVDRISSELTNRAVLTDSTPSPETTNLTGSDQIAANVTGASTADSVLSQLLAQNQAILKRLEEKEQTTKEKSASSSNRRTHLSKRTPPGPKMGQPMYNNPTWEQYCWTHGRCNHPGSECKRKAPGHKDDATITNKMNGSTYACPEE